MTTNKVSLQGDIPTPSSPLSAGSGATLGQSAGALPTPFDNAAQGMAVLNDQAPTPFSGGAGILTDGQSAGALPTPFDNAAQGMAVLNDQAPTPFSGGAGLLTDQTAPAPSPDIALGRM